MRDSLRIKLGDTFTLREDYFEWYLKTMHDTSAFKPTDVLKIVHWRNDSPGEELIVVGIKLNNTVFAGIPARFVNLTGENVGA